MPLALIVYSFTITLVYAKLRLMFYSLTSHCDTVTSCDPQVIQIFISTASIGVFIFCISYLAAKKLPSSIERAIVSIVFSLGMMVISYYLLYEQAFLAITPSISVELDRGDLIVFWLAVATSGLATISLVYMLIVKVIHSYIWILLIAALLGSTVSLLVYTIFEPFSTEMVGGLLP